ncbi:SDR family NAD(P)-dependent oxidoreductase [Pseudomonas sp. GB2N2]
MDLQLNGKRALVTGSSSGIGAGIARVLAAEGATVIIHGRDVQRTQAVAKEINDSGGTAHVALGDLLTVAGCNAVVEQTLAEVGVIDILVNNAGGKTTLGNPDWFDVPWTDWIGTYEQNVGAAVRLIQQLAPLMKARKWGRIIQIASASGVQPEAGLGEYQSAKAAMINLSVGLARSLGHTGITVNTVTPGTIHTPAVSQWLAHVAQQNGWAGDGAEIERRFTSEYIPLCVDHLGEPEDIGRVVALLASPLSGYISGANYRVDGGQCRSVN